MSGLALPPPPLSELPPGLLDPMIIGNDQSLFSIVTSVSNECDMGSHPPESLAREKACGLMQTRVDWLPPEPNPLLELIKIPLLVARGRLVSSWSRGITNY